MAVLAARLSSPRITGLYHDDGIYIATAKSLAETGTYRLIDLPGSPPQTKYPPLYPAVLAVVWRLSSEFPSNLWLLKLPGAILVGVIALLAHRLSIRIPGAPPSLRVVTALAVATAPGIFAYADLVLSELLFVALFLWVLVLDPLTEPETSGRRIATAAAVAGLAALTRSVGLAVALGLAWHVAARAGWRRGLAVAAIALAVASPWLVSVLRPLPPANELLAYYTVYERPAWQYLGSAPTLAWRIVATNAVLLSRATPLVFGAAWSPILVLFAVLAAMGAVSMAGTTAFALAWRVVALYCAAVLAHPYPMERYLVPLVPLGYLLMAAGSCVAVRALANGRLAVLPAALVLAGNVAWMAHFASVTAGHVHGELGRTLPFEWSGFEDTIAWVHAHVPPSGRIASSYDSLYFVYTGRQGVRPVLHRPEQYVAGYGLPAPTPDGPRLAADLRALGIDYVLIDPLLSGRESDYGRASIRAVLDDEPDAWRPAFTSADGLHQVYQRATSIAASVGGPELPAGRLWR